MTALVKPTQAEKFLKLEETLRCKNNIQRRGILQLLKHASEEFSRCQKCKRSLYKINGLQFDLSGFEHLSDCTNDERKMKPG